MMGVAMKRIFSILASLALLAFMASDGLAQRAVRVLPRTPANDEQRVALSGSSDNTLKLWDFGLGR